MPQKVLPIEVQRYSHFICRGLGLLPNRVEFGEGNNFLIVVENEIPALLDAAIQLHAVFAMQARQLNLIDPNRLHQLENPVLHFCWNA